MSFQPPSAGSSVTTSSIPPSKSSQQVKSLTASNICLFLSNLRLLNLDKRADWPDVTVRTFDTKDALHNQKKRISCVEWTLFRLFEIFDPAMTRDVSQTGNEILCCPFLILRSRNYSHSFRLWNHFNQSIYAPPCFAVLTI